MIKCRGTFAELRIYFGSIALAVMLFGVSWVRVFAVEIAESPIKALTPIEMGYVDFPPWTYEKAGKATGCTIELVRRIAVDQGLDIQYHKLPVSRLFKAIADGSIDFFVGITSPLEVRNHIIFRDRPVMVAELNLWAKKGMKIPAFESISSEGLIVMRGYNYGHLADNIASRSIEIVGASSHQDLYNMLMKGRAPFALDYLGPIRETIGEAGMNKLDWRHVQSFKSYFSVSKKAENAEMILDKLHRGLDNVRAVDTKLKCGE